MSWAEVFKINNNMDISLNELLLNILAGGYRQYIYDSQRYTVPFSGTYTIRAYCGSYGSYGKVVKNFTKGEILTITITGNTAITITSDLQGTSVFHINLAKDSYVNANSVDGIKAIAIGGAIWQTAGGDAYVRCNNGIAAGGGGSGGINYGNATTKIGYKGGNAYAYGTNVYALGGGGGGGGWNSSGNGAGGAGGNAFINGVELTDYCGVTTLKSGKGYNGDSGHDGSTWTYGGYGGNGGCGGGSGSHRCDVNTTTTPWRVGGAGYFSYGGYRVGGSARGGNIGSMHGIRNVASKVGEYGHPKGYFVGGVGLDGSSYAGAPHIGGTGGFLGGCGGNAGLRSGNGGKGGYSPYGFGGQGGKGFEASDYYYYGGAGGDGKIFGGNSGVGPAGELSAGGNGYYPGIGSPNGVALTNNIIMGTAPRSGMTPTTSIVIIEYGNSIEDF